jgi:hypothetical protein
MIGPVVLALALGCGRSGPPMAAATGTVTMAGRPVEGAIVMFVPASGQPGDGFTDASGHYTISSRGRPGVAIGTCKVTIVKPAADPASTSQGSSPEDLQRISETPARPKAPKPEIPEAYARAETTPLSVEITADAAANVFDFALEP